MLEEDKRKAIPVLRALGYGERRIAQHLRVSRTAVHKALTEGGEMAPRPLRENKAEAHRDRIVEEVRLCQGNLSLVHDELAKDGIRLGYSTIARFAHEHHLVKPPKLPVGRYEFGPGVEMQFDTSPHDVCFPEGKRRCQCASLVFCYSHTLFFQYYPRFTRFEARAFLTEALRYFEGACGVCMIDNTNIVILHGTGDNMVPCEEMKAFQDRFGFAFQAHTVGDKNRSGRVERPFHTIEHRFLPKRRPRNFQDLNAEARAWCDESNAAFKKRLHAKPVELLAAERPALKPLPLYIPEVYQLFQRTVTPEGHVNLHSNGYSVPYRLIGGNVEIRETLERITVYYKHQEVAVHDRMEPGRGLRSILREHRPPRGTMARLKEQQTIPEEKTLRADSEALDRFVTELRKSSVGRGFARIRRLHKMRQEYPRSAFLRTVEQALNYGLYDLNRLEHMILRNIARDYFPTAVDLDPNPEDFND